VETVAGGYPYDEMILATGVYLALQERTAWNTSSGERFGVRKIRRFPS
jgi:hypothetical protein